MPHSLRVKWMSEWQTPQKSMVMWTSRSPGARRSKANGASGAVAEVAAYPLVCMEAPDEKSVPESLPCLHACPPTCASARTAQRARPLRGVAVHAAEIHDRFRLAVEHVEHRGEMRDAQDPARVRAGMQQLQLAAARGHVAIDRHQRPDPGAVDVIDGLQIQQARARALGHGRGDRRFQNAQGFLGNEMARDNEDPNVTGTVFGHGKWRHVTPSDLIARTAQGFAQYRRLFEGLG